jgi:hypothetical protein
MRRGLQIVIGLLVVLLLVRPFDCFAYGSGTREAMECCIKGKCAPSAKADDCCENTIPDGNHFLGSKAADHSAPVFAITQPFISIPVPPSMGQGSGDLLRHPPPSGNLNARNLPLLI